MHRLPLNRSLPCLAALALFCAGGCSQESSAGAGLAPAAQAHSLAQVPDCADATVTADYSASAADVDGYYFISDGARVVCATDFDGLQVLALRFDGAGAIERPLTVEAASSEPMPGRGTNPGSTGAASSEPMPGRGNQGLAASDVGASEPMPGRGNSSGDPQPAPVRDPANDRVIRTTSH